MRGLTDTLYTHDSRGRTAPKGEYGYISKTSSMAVLQHLCNISKELLLCSACNARDVVTKVLRNKTRHCFRRKNHGNDAENMSNT